MTGMKKFGVILQNIYGTISSLDVSDCASHISSILQLIGFIWPNCCHLLEGVFMFGKNSQKSLIMINDKWLAL